jgi:Xaa-Pro aminopeptidase
MTSRESSSAGVFARRREQVLSQLFDGAMVLPAAPVRYKSGDSDYLYRPDSELFYVTGLTEPDSVAVLRGFADEERFVLFVPERDAKAERWSGPRLGPDRAAELLGADRAFPIGEVADRLPNLLEGAHLLHYRLGVDHRTQTLVEQALARGRALGQRRGTGPYGVMDPGQILSSMRRVKDRNEVAAIREAVGVTVQGFRAALQATAPGVTEREIQALLESTFLIAGAERPAFATIVGSGANACVLHYVENGRRVEEGDLVLIDAGAEKGLYSGDVTRTVPASGRFSGEQRAVYEVVLEAQRAALETVAPGIPVDRIHRAAVRKLIEGLLGLGVLRGNLDELVSEKAHEPYFPHQTSHWLGLDVHDTGDYVAGGESVLLEPGMVLTVEPGLYLPRNDDHLAGFAGIGVRTEDDVLVTEEGAEVLSAELPTDPSELEPLVGTRS